MRVLILILALVVLSGCQSAYVMPKDPFPSDVDLQGCDYPFRKSDDDAALGAAYLEALGQIELCNKRLEGVRKAKAKYKDLAQ